MKVGDLVTGATYWGHSHGIVVELMGDWIKVAYVNYGTFWKPIGALKLLSEA